MKFIIKIYLFIFVTIIFSIIYLYNSISETEHSLNVNLEKLFVLQAKEIANNIDAHLKEHIDKDIYKTFASNLKLRESFTHSLETLITQSYQYIYIVYKDKNGNFRYLLDGSSEADRGEFDEKLNLLSNKWDEAYREKKDVIIQQNNLDILWMTYLKPVVINGKTEAIIAIDFSVNLPQKIREATSPTRAIFNYIFVSIGFLLLILLYQTILHFRTKQESITDQLTKVYNRHFLRKFLEHIDIEKYQIIMLDIDYFKKINDNFGHIAGDYILKMVASILRNEIRNSDVIVRFGGEEFLIFIKNNPKKDEKVAIEIAKRMRKKIEITKFVFENNTIKVTASLGLSLHPEHFKTINEAIKYADNMLYFAKREGRNRIVYKRDDKKLHLSIKSINEVKEAIENDKLFCQFQPIYDLAKKEIVKYEALVRLIDFHGNIVYPDSFLDIISHTNIYRDLTKRVIDIVFKTIEEKSVYISLNLNFSDILDDDIFEVILDEVRQNSKLASWLTIELLEYEQLKVGKIVSKRLTEIKTYGVKIAIDDFGSGFANYDIFNLIPVDILKIDGSIIKNVATSKTSYSVVKSISTLSVELGVEVIAEYVESYEIFNVLKELNIKYGQGFYLAKPVDEID